MRYIAIFARMSFFTSITFLIPWIAKCFCLIYTFSVHNQTELPLIDLSMPLALNFLFLNILNFIHLLEIFIGKLFCSSASRSPSRASQYFLLVDSQEEEGILS